MEREPKPVFTFKRNFDGTEYQAIINGAHPELGQIIANQLNLLHSNRDIKRDIEINNNSVNYPFPYEVLMEPEAQTDEGKQALIDKIQTLTNRSSKIFITDRISNSNKLFKKQPFEIKGITIRNPDHDEVSKIVARVTEDPSRTVYVAKNENTTRELISNVVFSSSDIDPDTWFDTVSDLYQTMRRTNNQTVAVTIVRK